MGVQVCTWTWGAWVHLHRLQELTYKWGTGAKAPNGVQLHPACYLEITRKGIMRQRMG